MLILGIETAGTQVGVAIAGQEGVLASAHSGRDRRHAESLTPMIQFVANQARIDLTDVSAVAVDVGPGLFTGLRVGLASALMILSIYVLTILYDVFLGDFFHLDNFQIALVFTWSLKTVDNINTFILNLI